MFRACWAVVIGLLLLIPGIAPAAEGDLVGTWRVKLLVQGQQPTLWLLKVESADGKLKGSILGAADGLPPQATVEKLNSDGGQVRFTIAFGGQRATFEGKATTDRSKRILGSLDMGRQMYPSELEPSTLTSLDSYDVNKDILARRPNDPEVFDAAAKVLAAASAKKATPEEVRGWADKAYKASEAYGTRWQRAVTLRLAEALARQPELAAIGVEYARRAERMLDDADASAQMRTLGILADALKNAGKAAEAGDIQARLARIEDRAYQEYAKTNLPFKPEAYAGRKAKSDRAVLVELFTGAQCPPCVAADLAFDALDKSYKPGEVILLQYHLHIPGPDPLTNAASEARQQYYDRDIEGTPTILFDGKPEAPGGGYRDDAREKYQEYRKVLARLLEKPAQAGIQLAATRKGNKIDITVDVSGLAEANAKNHLRLALVEEYVHYAGRNGLRYHSQVVRAMPGGPAGIGIPGKSLKHAATVGLDSVRADINKYLAANDLADAIRPPELKRLKVVAFVQNDGTKNVLQAAEVDVKPDGGEK